MQRLRFCQGGGYWGGGLSSAIGVAIASSIATPRTTTDLVTCRPTSAREATSYNFPMRPQSSVHGRMLIMMIIIIIYEIIL